MDYPQIKKELSHILIKCASTISIDEHDYTHQPSNNSIASDILRIQEELQELRTKILLSDIGICSNCGNSSCNGIDCYYKECDATESDIY